MNNTQTKSKSKPRSRSRSRSRSRTKSPSSLKTMSVPLSKSKEESLALGLERLNIKDTKSLHNTIRNTQPKKTLKRKRSERSVSLSLSKSPPKRMKIENDFEEQPELDELLNPNAVKQKTKSPSPSPSPIKNITRKRKRNTYTKSLSTPSDYSPEMKRVKSQKEYEQFYGVDISELKEILQPKIGEKKVLIEYLKKVCPDTSVCIGFGEETKRIHSVFDNFVHYDSVDPSKTKILKKGANGVVFLLEFEKDGYNVQATLKLTLKHSEHISDNIYQDIANGYYLNKMNMYYPCFMETYGAYSFETNEDYNRFISGFSTSDTKLPSVKDLNQMKHIKNPFKQIDRACKFPHLNTVLVQFINERISLADFLQANISNSYVFTVVLVQILYQIYSVLAYCAYDFTHYDLHAENILLYKVPNDKYITMNYVDVNGKIIQFKTKYIAKIIDYGRCFTPNTKKIKDIICSSAECSKPSRPDNGNCGFKNGFNFFAFTKTPNKYYINSTEKNVSHDLRLLRYINSRFSSLFYEYRGPSTVVKSIVKDINRLFDDVVFKDLYGTPEIVPGKFSKKMNTAIYNVLDAHLRLLQLMMIQQTHEYFRRLEKEHYSGIASAGQMTIHLDRTKDILFVRE